MNPADYPYLTPIRQARPYDCWPINVNVRHRPTQPGPHNLGSDTASHIIVGWNMPKPDTERETQLLIVAAWKAAVECDPNVQVINIKSLIHDTTTNAQGITIEDPLHVTVSFKNGYHIRDNDHKTLHGYIDWSIERWRQRAQVERFRAIMTTQGSDNHTADSYVRRGRIAWDTTRMNATRQTLTIQELKNLARQFGYNVA
ncbi:uncharacterized protein BKA78DRAFT_292087 [Phyllosticta capitalensis]|uniref:uncharacterized protein n=1 Tax=Phyllosticta capitalensis TaxID=121624 RepID=UPI00312F1F35